MQFSFGKAGSNSKGKSINRFQICKIRLNVVFSRSGPFAVFRDRMSRNGENLPIVRLEKLDGCVTDATLAPVSNMQRVLSFMA